MTEQKTRKNAVCYECGEWNVKFKYKKRHYCKDCFFHMMGIEEREVRITQYFSIDGTYLADSYQHNMDDVLHSAYLSKEAEYEEYGFYVEDGDEVNEEEEED